MPSSKPTLTPTQRAVLEAARRYGLFRTASGWRAKGGRLNVSPATVRALVAKRCLVLVADRAVIGALGSELIGARADRRKRIVAGDTTGGAAIVPAQD
jgi:hypothetical protein